MEIKCRVNKDDNKTFRLVEFNAGYFNSDCRLKLITTDIAYVKQVFTSFNNIEIFIADNLVAEYNVFDGFSALSYIGNIWADSQQAFVECMEITLTKVSLVEQVQRIDEQLNPVIDVDSMTINQLKEYKTSLINTAGAEDIYSGDLVELSTKETKRFKYSQHDQANLESYLALILASDDRESLFIPYHAENEVCRQYNYIDIVLIYFTLSMKKLRIFTYVNMLRDWMNSMADREEIKSVEYGTELPAEYQIQMDEIMQGSLQSLMAIKEKFVPSQPELTPAPESEASEDPAADLEQTN